MKTINEIIKELRNDELKENPAKLSEYLVVLSASLNEAGNFELDAEMDYVKKWEEIKLSEEKMTDKMVDMKSKQTDEYKTWQQFRIANKTIQEVIRSIKKRLASLNNEYHSGQNY
jgi:hypothetical protein|tara:strand:- start:2304 stop:2648 length:345 start_codon:yes stop_codon:yes gene_type:complete